MKTNETKHDDQPLLYWELHDDSNKNSMFRSLKNVLVVFVLLAIGFGVGYVMKNSPTEVSTAGLEEMVGSPEMASSPEFVTPREFVVGDEVGEDEGCADCVAHACEVTLEQCENVGGAFVELLDAHQECKQCSFNIATAEQVVCSELMAEKRAHDCEDNIALVSADQCSQPREEILKMVADMNEEDHVCSSYPGNVGNELEKHCKEQGVEMSVLPKEGEGGELQVGGTEKEVGGYYECGHSWDTIDNDGFHYWQWLPDGHVTYLTKAGSPRACAQLCADAQSNNQPSCYWKPCTGDCWVASHGVWRNPRTNPPHTHHYFTFVNNRGRSHKVSHRDYYGGGYKEFKEYGNAGTFHCADEGAFCPCQGVVTYVRKDTCIWFGAGCSHLTWDKILAGNYGMRHYKVRGGIFCNNSDFGRDPDGGTKKQCYCHPASDEGTEYWNLPPKEWTEAHCKQRFAQGGGAAGFFRGFMTGFTCTGLCPAETVSAVAKGGTISVGLCTMSCFCLAKGWI